jgi:hypothetical protein
MGGEGDRYGRKRKGEEEGERERERGKGKGKGKDAFITVHDSPRFISPPPWNQLEFWQL